MSEVKKSCKYSKEHEWVELIGDNRARVGVTDYAQHSLGDIVFVELPELGAQIIKGESIGSIESVKAVSEIYTPINGTIFEVNQSLEDTPELLNEDPYEKGWIAIVEVKDISELEDLMSAEEYEAFLKEIE
ncbi:MAG: glycine cleavage system protein GcvH [Vulcanibacillus sp.]